MSKQKTSMAEAIAATIAPKHEDEIDSKEKTEAKEEIKKRVDKKIQDAEKEVIQRLQRPKRISKPSRKPVTRRGNCHLLLQ